MLSKHENKMFDEIIIVTGGVSMESGYS